MKTQNEKICKRCEYTKKDTIREVKEWFEKLLEEKKNDLKEEHSVSNERLVSYITWVMKQFNKKFGVEEVRK